LITESTTTTIEEHDEEIENWRERKHFFKQKEIVLDFEC